MIQFSLKRYKNGYLSNFYPCKIFWDGMEFQNSEAIYQSMKTLDITDRERFTEYDGKESKANGRKLTIRPDWDEVKYPLMVKIVYEKFRQNPELKEMLLSTGDEELLENTTGWHDNIWGNCNCEKCKDIEGQNLLGKALMEARLLLSKKS